MKRNKHVSELPYGATYFLADSSGPWVRGISEVALAVELDAEVFGADVTL